MTVSGSNDQSAESRSWAVVDESGAPPRFERPGSLFPWPEVKEGD